LTTPKGLSIWHGKSTTPYAKVHAKAIADMLKGDLEVTEFAEGSEPASFFETLGGKKTYISSVFRAPPKVFSCVNEMGEFKAKRLFDGQYCQAELDPTRLSIIDTGSQVWLWVGSKAKPKDKEIGAEVAEDYVAKIPDGRPKVVGKYVYEGGEPLEFGVVFQGFNYSGNPEKTGTLAELLGTFKVVLTLAQCKDKKSLPDTIDKSKLEFYLSDEEFASAFGMTKKEFEAVPKWKQGDLRKKVGIF